MTTKTKGNELSKLAQAEILSNIDGEPYGEELKTDEEKVKFLHKTFMSEYGWHVKQIGFQKALINYFLGLPSACSMPFINYDIIQLAVKWGSLPQIHTEREADKIINNYFNFMAMKTIQLFNKYKLNTVGE